MSGCVLISDSMVCDQGEGKEEGVVWYDFLISLV